MIPLLVLAAVVGAQVPAPAASAATYHLDAAGGSDTADGRSPASSWRSIERLRRVPLLPGDRVLFKRGGTWTRSLRISSSGTPEAPIVFGAYGTGSKPRISAETAIYAANADFITIQDLHLTGWAHRGIHNRGGDGWVIRRNSIDGGKDSSPMTAIYIEGGSTVATIIAGVTIDQNDIGPVGTYSPTTQPNPNDFHIVRTKAVDDAVVTRNEIHEVNGYAIFIDWDDDCVCWNYRAIVSENEIRDGFITGILVKHNKEPVIRANRVYRGAGSGIGINGGVDGAIVAYNLIHHLVAGAGGVLFNGIDVNDRSLNGTAFNNTVYSVENDSMTIEDSFSGPCDGWTIENNIFDASENSQVNIRDGRRTPLTINSGVTHWSARHNLMRPFGAPPGASAVVNRGGGRKGKLLSLAEWQRSGYGTGSTDRDPLFADPEAGDFALSEQSPAIGSGVRVGQFHDLRGTATRDPPSLGALEAE